MNSPHSTEVMVNKAFRLAYFIHGDKKIAIQVAAAALFKQEVAIAAQDKRLYYIPKGRSLSLKTKSEALRTKVSLSEKHLLQRLIYIESEPYERQKEQSNITTELDEECMVIHFIKHLVRITIRRNSFYVALGLSRLLHNYSTAETMEVYNVVVQDPDRVKDDYYYRSRKGRLMQEMKDRFGSLISTSRAQRGEERFQAQEYPSRFAELVVECLSLFTPWSSPCLLATSFNPVMDEIAPLCSKLKHPDEENEIEVNRIHTLLHPDCYGRLIKALGFGSPDKHLAIPQFNSTSNKGDGPRGNRHNPPELDDEEMALILGNLAEQSARRKSVSAGLLRVLVDGIEHARLNVQQTSHVQFDVEEGAEMIEVRTVEKEREATLAVHLLNYNQKDDEAWHSKTSIILEGGQKLIFEFSPSGATDELARAVVDITYKETNLVKAGLLSLRKMGFKLSETVRIKSWSGAAILKPALSVALIIICAIAVLYLVIDTTDKPVNVAEKQENPRIKENDPAPAVAPNDSHSTPEILAQGNISFAPPKMAPPHGPGHDKKITISDSNARRRLTYGEHKGRSNTIATPDEGVTAKVITRDLYILEGVIDSQDSSTRSTGAKVNDVAVSLLQVRKVYIQSRGDEQLSHHIRGMLISELQASSLFVVLQDPEEADASLKVFVKQKSNDKRQDAQKTAGGAARKEVIAEARASVIVQLINASGDVIWPVTTNIKGREYMGPTQGITTKVVTDLFADFQKLKGKR